MLLLYVFVLFGCFFNIFLKILLFLKSSLSLCSCNLSLHELDLIFSIIEQLLLFLELLVQLVDMRLEISAGSHDTLNLPIKWSLFLTEFEELLGISDWDLLLKCYLLFNLFLFVFTIFEGRFSNVLCAFKLFSEFQLISKFDLISLKFRLFCLQSLFFLK